MNDEQFGFGLKITIIITCIIVVAGIVLAINVLKEKENRASVLEEVSGTTGEAQVENDDELRQYLEVFALLIQEENPVSEKQLETTIGFLNQIFWYEPVQTEEGYVCYDEQTVKNVARELLGIANLETGEEIILDDKYNSYRYANSSEFLVGKCMEIINVNKKDNNYEIEYTCTFPGENGLYELSEGNEISLTTYKIKAELQKNESYEYSKYYLKNIELLSKDIVKYN